jgi:hypothetical protein
LERYVLEHAEIAGKIPRYAMVFMKGQETGNLIAGASVRAKRQAKKWALLISVAVKKEGQVHSRFDGLAFEHAA